MGGAWEWRGGNMHHHHRAGTHVQRHLCDDRNMINAFHYSSVNQSPINTHNRRTRCTPLDVCVYVYMYKCISISVGPVFTEHIHQLLYCPLAGVGATPEGELTCKQ